MNLFWENNNILFDNKNKTLFGENNNYETLFGDVEYEEFLIII